MEFEGFSEDELVRVCNSTECNKRTVRHAPPQQAVMNGNQTPVSVDITEEAMALGPEVLWLCLVFF